MDCPKVPVSIPFERFRVEITTPVGKTDDVLTRQHLSNLYPWMVVFLESDEFKRLEWEFQDGTLCRITVYEESKNAK